MKKKIFSFISTAFCSALIVGALSSNAFAAGDISVKIDDKPVEFTDVKPILENNRTFVPFRIIFEKMDAEVSWNGEDRSITAVRDDTTVQFTIGKQELVITENGQSQTKVIDVAPFIRNNSTYVPIRFASEALGACVDWVSDTRTVLIVDVDKLMPEYENEFKNIENYLAFANSTTNLNGTFNLSMQYKTAMGNIPVSATGTVSGTKNNNATELSGTVLTNTNDIKNAIIANEGENAANAELDSILNGLANSSFNAILNNNDNKLYLSGAVFNTLGLDTNTWAGISLDELNSSSSILSGSYDSFTDYLAACAQNTILYTNPNNTVGTIKAYLDNAKNLYGDTNFVKNEDGSLVLNGNNLTLKLNFNENNNISDALLTTTQTQNGVSISTSSHNTANNYDFSLNLTGGKNLDINLSLSTQKSTGDKTPTYVPNGDVIDIKLN